VERAINAIHQCLRGRTPEKVAGLPSRSGAFRDMTTEQLLSVTPEQALNHPTWRMAGNNN